MRARGGGVGAGGGGGGAAAGAMWRWRACAAALLLGALVCAKHDEDFAFDNTDDFQADISNNSDATNGLKRLWGIPDTTAYVGHLFRMEIPSEAFLGDVLAYKVRGTDGRRAPAWLVVDSRHGLLSGVPLPPDAGSLSLQVTAHQRRSFATDTFTVEVKRASEKPVSRYGACGAAESRVSLVLLLDVHLQQLSPRRRARALAHLASFMALDGGEFSIDSFKSYAGGSSGQSVLQSGPGSSQRRRGEGATTAIHLNVGCGGKLWPRHKVLVAGMREQARDGTLAHLLDLPLLGWRLVADKPAPSPTRAKRQNLAQFNNKQNQLPEFGSGGYDDGEDGDDGDYSGYDDDDTDDYGPLPDADAAAPGTSPPPAPTHPHRHHHGLAVGTAPSPSASAAATVSAASTPPAAPTAPAPAPTDSTSVSPAPDKTTSRADTTTEERPTSVHSPPEDATTDAPPSGPPPPGTATSPAPSPATSLLPPPAAPTDVLPHAAPEATAPPPPPPARTLTTNATPRQTDKKVEIVASESSAVPMSGNGFPSLTPSVRRKLDMPVVIVPDNTVTTTERTPTVLIQASSEPETETTYTEPTVQSSPSVSLATAAAVPSSSTSTTSTSTTSTTTTTTTTTTMTTPRATVATTPETTLEVTQQEPEPTTQKSSTIIGRTTETVEFHMPPTAAANQPPQLSHHMKKLPVTAGKAFRYLIKDDLFTDPEDGTNLTYSMYEATGAPLNATSWVQFMPAQKEVYGLPLQEHVSRWSFKVQAEDSAGAAARAPLDIIVQHHKGQRTLNHQFYIDLKVLHEYPAAIDWQIRVLEGLVNLFRDTDMEHIVVRNVSALGGGLVRFLWSDDTLPKETCPSADIQRRMAVLESETEKGAPSANLSRVMQPELRVSGVGWRGAGTCGEGEAAGAGGASPAGAGADTYPPLQRNQVDLVQATAGHLLVFKVPQDTFYDAGDGGTRLLKLSVVRADRSPLPSAHWMQFDRANQEFYGLPTDRDIGKKEYQLIAEDSTGMTASDMLLVEVNPAPAIQPPVEFHMTMNSPYSELAGSALAKRTFLENLARLFGDRDASSIRVKSITDKPTTVVWFNTSLPMDKCPTDEIEALKSVIIKEEPQGAPESLTDRVDLVFHKQHVMSIRLIPRGLCALQMPAAPARPPTHGSGTAGAAGAAGGSASADRESKSVSMHEYVVTFIVPAIVVVCMILVAGVIACVLYRRRRTGKMSVGDEEERQAFRSKGIPVIFQDELEDKPDPGNKTPVIMKEEKPPLLPPPDYRADADSPTPSHRTPYRPPPPFTAVRDPRPAPRPKATPTYRKPPPYVPP